MTWRISKLGMLVAMICLNSNVLAQQPKFRVETDVYVGANKEPAQQYLTLFSQGIYYDFSYDKPELITVIDPARKQIAIFDSNRKMQLVDSMDRLTEIVERAKLEAPGTPLAVVIAASELVKVDRTTGKIVVGDATMRYEATLQASGSPEMTRQYADFANWSARVNSVRPPYLPPYTRLSLNQAIADSGQLPNTIIRTSEIGGRIDEVSCKLIPGWRLSSDDEAKIANIGVMESTFKHVTETEFFPQLQARRQTTSVEK
ncbi:MAG: hypothetical protein KDB03_13080 [Planctomycetales bacterium]|nr:hypothetical protein [Planctomycetales bacterium]